jgi:hypothetical protein
MIAELTTEAADGHGALRMCDTTPLCRTAATGRGAGQPSLRFFFSILRPVTSDVASSSDQCCLTHRSLKVAAKAIGEQIITTSASKHSTGTPGREIFASGWLMHMGWLMHTTSQPITHRTQPNPTHAPTPSEPNRRTQDSTATRWRPIRLSATVTPKFFPLYHFFPLFFPLCFHLPQRFPLNTPSIPHYNYKILFPISTTNFLSTNNYSWPHNTVL